MNDKYAVITVGKFEQSKRDEIMSKLPDLLSVSRDAGSSRAVFGTIMTGLEAGSAIMVQFFEELAKLESVYAAFAQSKAYSEVMASGLKITMRNITTTDLNFAFSDNPNLKYSVMTRAVGTGKPQDLSKLIEEAAGLFKENGAQTLRFGRLMTGSNAGDYLLGVSYSSMSEIEKTYDAIATSHIAKKVYAKLEVNRRGIFQIGGLK